MPPVVVAPLKNINQSSLSANNTPSQGDHGFTSAAGSVDKSSCEPAPADGQTTEGQLRQQQQRQQLQHHQLLQQQQHCPSHPGQQALLQTPPPPPPPHQQQPGSQHAALRSPSQANPQFRPGQFRPGPPPSSSQSPNLPFPPHQNPGNFMRGPPPPGFRGFRPPPPGHIMHNMPIPGFMRGLPPPPPPPGSRGALLPPTAPPPGLGPMQRAPLAMSPPPPPPSELVLPPPAEPVSEDYDPLNPTEGSHQLFPTSFEISYLIIFRKELFINTYRHIRNFSLLYVYIYNYKLYVYIFSLF